ncbi:MAG: rhodanese-like domain-containing protein [Deltaproteobacteria bacterium]|nr:rhodanese-like domain-containing protein [Deltaproteobacteria bacterium]
MKHTPALFTTRILMLALLVFLAFSCPVFSAEPVLVDAAQVKKMMDDNSAFVVFPLSAIEYNNLHIEGSVNIPIEELPAGLPDDKKYSLVFYCLGGT